MDGEKRGKCLFYTFYLKMSQNFQKSLSYPRELQGTGVIGDSFGPKFCKKRLIFSMKELSENGVFGSKK